MFPAARITDPITHDMLVPCGLIGPPMSGMVPLVLIEGLPAAFVTCICVCTGVISGAIAHPPIPGPQPPIVKGSLTVLIGNFPAARWAPSLDVGACGVFLGDPKLAAARTVLIGDAGSGGPAGGAGAAPAAAAPAPAAAPADPAPACNAFRQASDTGKPFVGCTCAACQHA